jgi:hypothetical protein
MKARTAGTVGLGVLLALEGLDVTLPLPVRVVDDPRLALFTMTGRPLPLANRHEKSPL